MSLTELIAPRYSKRRLCLKIGRSLLLSPKAGFARLSTINFRNAAIASRARIQCPVCGTDAGLYYDFPDVNLRKAHGIGLLRETLSCLTCGATMRDRQMALGLLKIVKDMTGRELSSLLKLGRQSFFGLRVLDTDSFSPMNRILRGVHGYSHSQYRPDLASVKELPDGSLNVNLLSMDLEPSSFDIIMTSDVMEHVEDDESAHREIFRCLKPGGIYLFTIPYDQTLAHTRKLTLPSGNPGTPFILEHHIHGDPHSADGIVAHRIYGQSLHADMKKIGYDLHFKEIHDPHHGVYGGDLFFAHKLA